MTATTPISDDDQYEVEIARGIAEGNRVIAALIERHGDDREAAREDFRAYIKTRPDLMEACITFIFRKIEGEEGFSARRDN